MFKKQLILLIALFCSAGLCFGSATAAFAKVGISTADASAVSSMPSDYILELGNGMADIPSQLPDGGEAVSSEQSSSMETLALSSAAASGDLSSQETSSENTSAISSAGSSEAASSDASVSSAAPASSAPAASSSAPSQAVSSSQPADSGSNGGNSNTGNSGETLTVSVNGRVQTLSVVDAVSRVVMNEMGSSFETEALKAQAVAAHTYIKYYNNLGKAPSVGARTPDAKVINAVTAVQDKMVYYNGSPINAVYCASVADRTNSAADVWGGNIPYLVSVESPYDRNTTGWQGRVTYSVSQFQSLVKQKTGISLTGDPAGWLSVTSRTSGGYVGNLTLGGYASYGSTRLTGRVMRETITNFALRSAKFDYSVSGDTITFTTYGYGHGVGMSQHGANEYAKRGWTYDQILTHYYTGTVVK